MARVVELDRHELRDGREVPSGDDVGALAKTMLSNTLLAPAIALYRKHGFRTVSEGRHPVYARCDLVMERSLD